MQKQSVSANKWHLFGRNRVKSLPIGERYRIYISVAQFAKKYGKHPLPPPRVVK